MPDLGLTIWFLGKLFALFAFFIYLVFAAVVVRQVYLMTQTIKVGFEAPIKIIAWTHLGVAILASLFVLVFL